MMMFKFQATDSKGKTIRFNVREVNSPNASRYAWDRAIKIAAAIKDCSCSTLKFSD